MERSLGEKITERIKKFKKWEIIVMLVFVGILFGGILYYSESDRFQFEKTLKEVQKQVARYEGETQTVIGAPQGIVPLFQDMITGCKEVEIGVDHPAGDARRSGCEFFVAEKEVPGEELQETGYQLVSQNGDYRIYETIMEDGDWMITQFGTSSGLQSMCYSLVSEDGRFILLDGGHDVDEEMLRRLIDTFGNHVDLWICSHFHEDHIGAITAMLPKLRGVSIDELWCPPMDMDTYLTFAKEWDSIDTCRKFLSEIADAGAIEGLKNVTRIQDGEERDIGNLHFIFFSAYSDGAQWTHEGNNCGFIFKVCGKTESMLFCCDVGNDWMSERLIAGHGDKLKADYVQMGHHGNGGLTEEAYRLIAPKAAFFDGPGWLFADEEKYTAAKNRRLMEELGCKIYLMDEAPNTILLK